MAYKSKVIDFNDDKERTEKFDTWMQAPGNEDVRIKHAILSSDQAFIIYDDETSDVDAVKPSTR
jgi:hypothetical protein